MALDNLDNAPRSPVLVRGMALDNLDNVMRSPFLLCRPCKALPLFLWQMQRPT